MQDVLPLRSASSPQPSPPVRMEERETEVRLSFPAPAPALPRYSAVTVLIVLYVLPALFIALLRNFTVAPVDAPVATVCPA